MSIQSRFTSSDAAVEFEIRMPDELQNRETLFVSHVVVNFGAAPTTAGNVQILHF